MPLQATSGAASYDAFGGGVPVVPAYIEEVFSTYLYTGTGAAQTITNGIDLAGKGGLVWVKPRNGGTTDNVLSDTVTGRAKYLITNSAGAQGGDAGPTRNITSFNSDGFSLGTDFQVNFNGAGLNTVSWTFRKQPKFFDVVTFTADLSNANQRISHNLGSVPGTIIIKCTNIGGSFSDWWTYHRSLGRSAYLKLNATTASTSSTNFWGTSDPTSTDFGFNAFDWGLSDGTYVAYLFAHDAGGFGLTGTDNVISCGSYYNSGSAPVNVNLGYEPQWILIKKSDSAQNWFLMDTMRGDSLTAQNLLKPNTSDAETVNAGAPGYPAPTATGFTTFLGAEGTFIYIAIRRGPMKVPTDATKVFAPLYESGTGSARTVNAGFPTDLFFIKDSTGLTGPTAGGNVFYDRLRGNSNVLQTQSTSAEAVSSTYTALFNSVQNGVVVSDYWSSYAYREYCFRRAPSFFDEVCYTGTGVARTVTHNLGVVPEMVIVKNRNFSAVWMVYHAALGNTGTIYLNDSDIAYYSSSYWNSTTPTSSAFSLGTSGNTNGGSGQTYVAYLFATCAGVSKVGSYTGTGTTLQVNCGFTAGARFVLIKRADSTGDWYVWDTARGIVSGNDPYLLLNSTAADVNNTDYIDTYSAGFEISSTAPSAINASGGTFIFLAIA